MDIVSVQTGHGMQVNGAGKEQDDIVVDLIILLVPSIDDTSFGPWLKPRSGRGPIWGQGGAMGALVAATIPWESVTWLLALLTLILTRAPLHGSQTDMWQKFLVFLEHVEDMQGLKGIPFISALAPSLPLRVLRETFSLINAPF